MSDKLLISTMQSAALSAISNVLAQLITAYRDQVTSPVFACQLVRGNEKATSAFRAMRTQLSQMIMYN